MRRIVQSLRHPLLALAVAASFAVTAVVVVRGGLTARAQFAATAADPVKIADRALDRSFDRDVAEREIRAALAADDIDLAQSFVALAADRAVPVEPALTAAVNDAAAKHGTVTNTAGRFVRGLWTGEPTDLASLAGTAVGDLFVFGDIRDATREGARYLTGQKYDPWILGLAGVGIGITAATYASLGASAPERLGLSVIKAAKRTGRLNPVLAVRAAREAIKVESAGGLVELAENTGRIESKAGAQAALDGLAIAEEPADVSRLARLSAAKGGKTRAIVKLLGRGAIILTASALDLTLWIFWAALALFGFCSSCKAAVERLTLRHLQRRKLRLARAELALQPVLLR
ncbi:MAG TPA: hypothetical protein VMA30_21980 [Xanthobacteraceae bacterium]|nr:hypothetical protein [Xanthobacteraceae bacterium]